jgi:hypothetical protein
MAMEDGVSPAAEWTAAPASFSGALRSAKPFPAKRAIHLLDMRSANAAYC